MGGRLRLACPSTPTIVRLVRRRSGRRYTGREVRLVGSPCGGGLALDEFGDGLDDLETGREARRVDEARPGHHQLPISEIQPLDNTVEQELDQGRCDQPPSQLWLAR